jgi:hypothetical protein
MRLALVLMLMVYRLLEARLKEMEEKMGKTLLASSSISDVQGQLKKQLDDKVIVVMILRDVPRIKR